MVSQDLHEDFSVACDRLPAVLDNGDNHGRHDMEA